MSIENKRPLVLKPVKERETVDSVVIHFAGDSGDGMQVTGALFTAESALHGNDIQTFPDFPAEIRAPAGTVAGVSGFQLRFSDHPIHTPGDKVDVLVAMNPAALKSALPNVKPGALIVLDTDKFTEKDFKKAGLDFNPLESDLLSGYSIISAPITHLTLSAVESAGLSRAQSRRAKNLFALGMMFWLYNRSLEHTIHWIEKKFSDRPDVIQANIKALKAGYQYAISAELFEKYYEVSPMDVPPGDYRQLTANQAVAWGCVAAATLSEQPVLMAGYPITPASDILHHAAGLGDYGVTVFQAEDEMAAVGAAIGAAYAGSLGITCTSGPGLDLKMESIGLAVMAELPLVIVDVQRAGPSTGMPTKTEQSDLLAAVYGRHGECPVPVLAPSSPSEAFECTLEAFRMAVRYMTPVILLSDGYLANGSEAWRIPNVDDLPSMKPEYFTSVEQFEGAYQRINPDTLARPWIRPGTPGLMHRIGGLEKSEPSGAISYEPENHAKMVARRAQKVAGVETTVLPAVDWIGPKQNTMLVVTWGSTYGPVRSAVEAMQKSGFEVSGLLIRLVNPLPSALKKWCECFKKVVVVELNCGQLCQLVRAQTLVDAQSITQVTGKPFHVDELIEQLAVALEGVADDAK